MSVNYSSEGKTMHFKWSVQTAPLLECLQTSPGSHVMTTSQGTCDANIWPEIRKDKYAIVAHYNATKTMRR